MKGALFALVHFIGVLSVDRQLQNPNLLASLSNTTYQRNSAGSEQMNFRVWKQIHYPSQSANIFQRCLVCYRLFICCCLAWVCVKWERGRLSSRKPDWETKRKKNCERHLANTFTAVPGQRHLSAIVLTLTQICRCSDGFLRLSQLEQAKTQQPCDRHSWSGSPQSAQLCGAAMFLAPVRSCNCTGSCPEICLALTHSHTHIIDASKPTANPSNRWVEDTTRHMIYRTSFFMCDTRARECFKVVLGN